jgi:hypothetical protein
MYGEDCGSFLGKYGTNGVPNSSNIPRGGAAANIAYDRNTSTLWLLEEF